MKQLKKRIITTVLGCSLLLGACQGGHSDPLADHKYKIEDTDYSIAFDGKDRATLSWTDGAPNNMVKDSTPFNYEIKKDNGKQFLVLERSDDELPSGYKDEFQFYEDKSVDYDHNRNCEVYEIKDQNKDDLTLVQKAVAMPYNDNVSKKELSRVPDDKLDKDLFKHPDKAKDSQELKLTDE